MRGVLPLSAGYSPWGWGITHGISRRWYEGGRVGIDNLEGGVEVSHKINKIPDACITNIGDLILYLRDS